MNVNLPQEFFLRLREERKRLGMNQTTFAKATGVHLNTQSRYEKGERAPDTTYLAAVAKVGVDMTYLLSGDRGKDHETEFRAIQHVLNVIQGFLGFWRPPLSYEFEQKMQDVYVAKKTEWDNPVVIEQADYRLREMLKKSAEILPTLQQLQSIIFSLERVQERIELPLSARDKAESILRIYQEEKRTEKHLSLDEVERIVRSAAFL